MKWRTSWLLVPFVALLGLAARRPARELELTYLANEGFLVRVGETSLVIDAFVRKPLGEYAAVPDELFAALVAGRAPFEGVDLVLTSHHHFDHFQPGPAVEYVGAWPKTPFVSSPQVIDEVKKELGAKEGALQALLPGDGDAEKAEANGIALELLRLPHTGGARTSDVQNLGHLIELGGVHLLHVGDANVGTEALAGYALAERGIDVALVPYWWLNDAEDLARVTRLTGAKHLVAMHVPPVEMAAVKKTLAGLSSELVCLEKPGEAKTFTIER